jgi:cytochrome c oxidase accessory protein FixG
MAVSTGLLYFNFGWFREQLCIVICPYGRIQSALIDDHSLVIGYDAKRGEPRMTVADAKRWSAVSPARAGDCVACNRCVQVCPTGIDIRQGLQMECVGCTACIDACDDVMTRLHRPRGLIRYDSQNGFTGRPTRWLRPRTMLYFALLLAGAGVATWALSTVKPASFGITRMIGAPYIVDEAAIRNQFLVRIVNKRNAPAQFVLHLDDAPAGLRQTGFESTVEVEALGEVVLPLVLQQDRARYTGTFDLEARLTGAGGGFQLERKLEFLGPEARLLREEEEEKHRARDQSH